MSIRLRKYSVVVRQCKKQTICENLHPFTFFLHGVYYHSFYFHVRLIKQNNSKINYTDPKCKKYNYAVFWAQITNETINPVELKINFPLDSFEFPRSSGNYMKLLIPSVTMTPDKASLADYGLAVKSFLDTGINKSYCVMQKTPSV